MTTEPMRPAARRLGRAYDDGAAAYGRWWGPVIARAALSALDHVGELGELAAPTILDIGTGDGVLAIAALRRWPRARVLGVDASRGMLDQAADAAARADVRDRLDLVVGDALALPLGDRSVDAVVSSFVIQLTGSRRGTLREAARVLRPGGRFAVVTWQAADDPFPPAVALDEALDEVGAPEANRSAPPRPWPSAAVARRELRAAGFTAVGSATGMVEHRYTAAGYLEMAEHWIVDDVFARMDEEQRRRARGAARRRLARIPAADFVWRAPTIVAFGRAR